MIPRWLARLSWTMIAVPCLALASGCEVVAPTTDAEAATSARLEVRPLEAAETRLLDEVNPGDTIESLCRRMAGDDWTAWRDALASELDPKRLLPGITFDGTLGPSGRLRELRVVLDRRRELLLSLSGDEIVSRRHERPIDHSVLRISGSIDSSLFAAMDAAGGGPELAVRVAEVFQWDIDFLRDLRQGDRFVVVADELKIDGQRYGFGTVFAARFENRGRVLNAIAYPDGSGRLGFYDLEGRPLRKQFLRSPLKLSRITSRFSLHRYHPVLKRRMPHYGVDYGAPVGTPVHATADGTVTFSARKGGAGRMVTLRHPNGFETNYLHLSRYGSGIRRGVRVAQGQVVGYVGSSGLSTGPHLDYRVKLGGSWINPLSIASPPVEPLAEERLAPFLSHTLAVLTLVEGRQLPAGARCAVSLGIGGSPASKSGGT